MSLFLNTREKRLIQAIEDNNIGYINHLLSSKKSLNINYKSRNNVTPLLLATSLSDREDIIKIILNAENVNVNLKTKDNETALHLAIPNYNLEIIQLLIESNINLNEKDRYGKTAIVKIIELIKRYTIPNEVLNDSIINFATASSVYSDDTITSISIDGCSEQNSSSDKNNEEKILAKLMKRKSLKDESFFDEISLSSDFSLVENDDSGSLDICENYIESLSISLKKMDINEITNHILNDDDKNDSLIIEENENNNVNKNIIQEGNENLMVNTKLDGNKITKEKIIKEDNIESAKTIGNENENDIQIKPKYENEIQNKKFIKDFNNINYCNGEMNIMTVPVEIRGNKEFSPNNYISNDPSDIKTPVFKEEIQNTQEVEQQQLTEETTETKYNTPSTSIYGSTTGSVTLRNNANEAETSKLSDIKSIASLESISEKKLTEADADENNSFSKCELQSIVGDEAHISNRTNHLSLLSYPDQYNILLTKAKFYKNTEEGDNNDEEDNSNDNLNIDSNVHNYNEDITPHIMKTNNNDIDLDNINETNNNTIKNTISPTNYDMSLKDCQKEIRDIRLSEDEDDENQEENNTSGNSNNSTSTSEFSYLPSEIKAKKQDFYGKDFCGKSNINLNIMDNNSFVESIIPYENVSLDSIFINRNPSRGHSLYENKKTRNRYSAITLSAYDKLRLSQLMPYDKSKKGLLSKTLISELSYQKYNSEFTDQSSYIENNTRRETKRQKAKKYLAMLELLLWNDADPNIQDFDGRTSLIIACIYKLRQVVPILLRYGTSVNTKDYLGKTALMYSCEKQEDGIVKQLLSYHSNINLQDKNGLTALMLACKFDNEEIIRLLLENRARVNRQDKNGDTALTYASRYGCSKAVYLLMRYCANGNIKNKRGETALIIACRHVNEDIIRILINQPIDIDLQDRNGNTALIYLCQKKNEYTELVREILLKHNVNINIKNKAGNSALHIAVFNNHLEIVKLLLLNHADINIKNGEGNTVLMMASSSANREQMVQLLLSFSDCYLSPRNIIKVLHLRKKKKLRKEQLDELLLLNTHIDINAMNNEGDTALMIASRNGNPKIVNDLLQYQADCNLQNNRLETAIIKAIKSMNKCTDKEPIEKYQQIIKLLILNDADTHIKDYKKRDFIYYAKSNKSLMHSLSKYQKPTSPKQYYRY